MNKGFISLYALLLVGCGYTSYNTALEYSNTNEINIYDNTYNLKDNVHEQDTIYDYIVFLRTHVVLDDTLLGLTLEAIMTYDDILVPITNFAELINYDLLWYRNNNLINLLFGSNNFIINLENNTYTINKECPNFLVNAGIFNNTLYVSVSFILKYFGTSSRYFHNTIYIYTYEINEDIEETYTIIVDNTNVMLDNVLLENSLTIVMNQHDILVPVIEITEVLGANLSWEHDSSNINISLNNNNITINLGDNVHTVNGECIYFSTIPILFNDVPYIPLEFINRYFGIAIWFIDNTIFMYSDGSIINLNFDISYYLQLIKNTLYIGMTMDDVKSVLGTGYVRSISPIDGNYAFTYNIIWYSTFRYIVNPFGVGITPIEDFKNGIIRLGVYIMYNYNHMLYFYVISYSDIYGNMYVYTFLENSDIRHQQIRTRSN